MFENLRADLKAAATHRRLERGWRVIIRRETKVILQYRFSHWAHTLRVPVVRQILIFVALLWQRWIQIIMAGVIISPDAEIGPGMILHTAYGLQIAPVKIGSGCTFNSQVLIGTGVKSIGNNCYFGPGSKIVGECKIGNNVLVVANSVVLTDVPDNTTIMGVPARIKLPGGRLRKMPWRSMDAKQNVAPMDAAGTNGAKTNGAKGNGAKTNGTKSNGAKANTESEPKPEPQQKINA
jgi:serine O-acetyltransferase